MIIGMIRYAIPNAFAKNNSRSIVQLYEDPYFSDRFKIFCEVTLKSFERQTCKDFVLLIYHTDMIPNDKKDLFEKLIKIYPFIRNVYISNQEMIIPDDLKTKELFTFRIDNDDGIINDFIEKLQKVRDMHKDISNFAINIPLMRQVMRIDTNCYKTALVNYVSNSMGLAYFGTDGRTIMDVGQHTEVYKLVPTFFIEGNGGLQILNGYNAANQFTKKQVILKNHEDLNKILIKENYSEMDLTCLPIIKPLPIKSPIRRIKKASDWRF